MLAITDIYSALFLIIQLEKDKTRFQSSKLLKKWTVLQAKKTLNCLNAGGQVNRMYHYPGVIVV